MSQESPRLAGPKAIALAVMKKVDGVNSRWGLHLGGYRREKRRGSSQNHRDMGKHGDHHRGKI